MNEFLKHSRHEFGVIRPIYKNKGYPNNYTGMSLLSCFGNLFTSCLNRRLTIFIENNDIVQADLAGF